MEMTATGELHACLGHDDAVSLRDVLRSGGSEQDLIRAISGRPLRIAGDNHRIPDVAVFHHGSSIVGRRRVAHARRHVEGGTGPCAIGG